jgi:SAM-dependent methyltransferase
MSTVIREQIKAMLGPRWATRLRVATRGLPVPRWGNLRRTRPFSEQFGFDRGTPIDRYYLHRFLDANRACITGAVLEIQMSSYTKRYGSRVVTAHTVDINPAHDPTYVCDLAQADRVIPAERYDCLLLPNSLSFFRDLDGCLRQALRVVKPGGVILASTAGFVPLVPDMPEYWRMSAEGWREVSARAWPGCEVSVEAHGNCLAAVAAMLGLAHEELAARELDSHDPRYPVLVTVRCRRPGAS